MSTLVIKHHRKHLNKMLSLKVILTILQILKELLTEQLRTILRLERLQRYTEDYKKQAALAALGNKHPDMQTILADPKFAEWIKASKIRTQLFVQADQQYNADAADELFSLWKDRRGSCSANC